jgi:hypothetical protein
MPEAKPVPPGSSFAYDVAVFSLEEQRKRIDALDSKAGVTLAAAGVFAGFLFRGDSLLRGAPSAVGAGGSILLVLSMLAALLAFANRRYRIAPAAEAVAGMMSFPDEWLKWRFLGNLLEAVEVNRAKLSDKTRWLTAAQAALLAAVGVIGGYFVYVLITGRVGGS